MTWQYIRIERNFVNCPLVRVAIVRGLSHWRCQRRCNSTGGGDGKGGGGASLGVIRGLGGGDGPFEET